MNENVKVKLRDGREIELKPLKAGALHKVDKESSVLEKSFILISCMSGLTIAELDELDTRDFAALQKAGEAFLSE